MSWLAFHRTEAATALIGKHPAAFLLLSAIAIRARFHPDPCPVTGLKHGQCFIGDWKECGQKSYKQYRVSKNLLEKMKFAAFSGASRGTIAELLQVPEISTVYSVSINRSGQAEGQDQGQARGKLGATEGPLTNKDRKKEGDNHEVSDFWNSIESLPAIRSLGSKRRTAINSRLKEPFFRENWQTAITKIPSCPFLMGGGNTGWKANFDWFLKPESAAKIIEGQYDSSAKTNQEFKASNVGI